LLELGLADEVVPEPLGGAHNDAAITAETLKQHLLRNLEQLQKIPSAERLRQRYEKFRAFGHYADKQAPPDMKPV